MRQKFHRVRKKFHRMRKMSQGLKYFLRHFCLNYKFGKVSNIKGEISKG